MVVMEGAASAAVIVAAIMSTVTVIMMKLAIMGVTMDMQKTGRGVSDSRGNQTDE